MLLGNYPEEPEDLLEEYKLFAATAQPAFLLAKLSQAKAVNIDGLAFQQGPPMFRLGSRIKCSIL